MQFLYHIVGGTQLQVRLDPVSAWVLASYETALASASIKLEKPEVKFII